jgi:hypothetical protein
MIHATANRLINCMKPSLGRGARQRAAHRSLADFRQKTIGKTLSECIFRGKIKDELAGWKRVRCFGCLDCVDLATAQGSRAVGDRL